MKRFLYLILKKWSNYLEWTENQTGYLKYLASIFFFIYVAIFIFIVWFLIFAIFMLISDFNGFFTGDGIIQGIKNLFSETFWMIGIFLVVIIAFYAFGIAAITVEKIIKFILDSSNEDNKDAEK